MKAESIPDVILSERFQDGLDLALSLHRFQARKGTGVPYASHLLAVASLVLEAGGTEDEAISGLLHDAKEDAGGPPVVALIRGKFGDPVADIVEGCSERYAEPKPPWLQRKIEYIARMPGEPASVHLVSSADKVHNIRSLLADFITQGDALWQQFSVGREGTVWYYRSLADVFAQGPSRLAPVLEEAVSGLEACAGMSGRSVEPSEAWEKSAAQSSFNGLARALAIAHEVHANQTDKAGAPYIFHPLRIMARMTSPPAMMAALLHDVVEDSAGAWTLDRLRQEGFPDDVVSAVDAVTFRAGESYDDFVQRATAHPIGREVKLADLEDNMDIRRLPTLTERDIERLTRYHRVWRQAGLERAGGGANSDLPDSEILSLYDVPIEP